ncbi:MAG: sigma-54-dependent Fis family transcriptional regulator [Clostridiales Family XIII bacterium]|jgi:transcriptional regulator of acetoin/glycerol metabolism|nr:sigma-54-dependent Fis family transcriptional regulator [Clostridiales Family XIII bacterium]
MHNFTEEYRAELKATWEHFIAFEPCDDSTVRPEILASWQRSRSYRVDPVHAKTVVLSAGDIDRRIEGNKPLIQTVRAYMERLYSIVKGSGFYLMLSDRDGVILDLLGDADIVSNARDHSNLVVGADRSESFAGTNAIGLCLVLGRPVQIWSDEHYISPHKAYTCSAGPIYDPGGELIGCLTLTGHHDRVHPHTLGMVLCAVDGISNELKIRAAYTAIESISAQRNVIIDSLASGFIMLDGEDRIVQINKIARGMLGIHPADSVDGSDFFDLFTINDAKSTAFRFSQLTRPVLNRETNFYLRGSGLPPVKLTMSVNFSEADRKNIVVRFEESKQIHSLVNKVGGFKAFFTFDSILGNSTALRQMIEFSRHAAKSSSNILILGDSGAGKELVAQAIHNSSNYAGGPFVAINCGALPKGLIESELFGYEGGAFTGANKDGNPGKFELADGGTLFLDEIGDMPLDVQASLLRVIQTREIVRIGAKYSKKINVRIIAATHRNLRDSVENKSFREDLYYRLNVLIINVPPLRDRDDDVCELADHFLQPPPGSKGPRLSFDPEVYGLLRAYPWPGNVRELENAIERAMNIADGSTIRAAHLPLQVSENARDAAYGIRTPDGQRGGRAAAGADAKGWEGDPPQLNLRTSGYSMILSSLEKTGGNVKKSADLLGISRRTLYRKMEKFNIDYSDYR